MDVGKSLHFLACLTSFINEMGTMPPTFIFSRAIVKKRLGAALVHVLLNVKAMSKRVRRVAGSKPESALHSSFRTGAAWRQEPLCSDLSRSDAKQFLKNACWLVESAGSRQKVCIKVWKFQTSVRC